MFEIHASVPETLCESTPRVDSGDLERLAAHLRPRRRKVEAALADALEQAAPQAAELAEAVHHAALGSGGKRMRPLLAILAAEACGGDLHPVLPTACALELIHACSLIQDDLPAMDNDRFRRGHPTCHVRFGEAATILAGDALLARAFELLATPVSVVPLSRHLAVTALVARSIGLRGMAGGQFADLKATGEPVTVDTLAFIHRHKTGAFLQACVLSGALLAGATEVQRAALERYSACIGLAFQIVDDLLNELGDAAVTGKAVGSDRDLGKATYPGLFGLEASRRMATEAIQEALRALDPFGSAGDPLRWTASYILMRDR